MTGPVLQNVRPRPEDLIHVGGNALVHPVDGHVAEFVVVVDAQGRVVPGVTVVAWHGSADGVARPGR